MGTLQASVGTANGVLQGARQTLCGGHLRLGIGDLLGGRIPGDALIDPGITARLLASFSTNTLAAVPVQTRRGPDRT